MMMAKAWQTLNGYLVLNIPLTAGPEEIRAAYRAASKKSHPDLPGGSTEAQQQVNLAYEILSNPVDRHAHDLFWFGGALSGTVSARRKPPARKPQAKPQTKPKVTKPVLTALFARIDQAIAERTAELTQGVARRTEAIKQEYTQKLLRQRRMFRFGLASAGVGALFALQLQSVAVWLGVIGIGLLALLARRPVEAYGEKIRFYDRDAERQVARLAKTRAEADSQHEIQLLQEHRASLTRIVSLLGRSSARGDSEAQVARRLTIALFMMGYLPTRYDAKQRLIYFKAGQESFLVRFRHREGAAINVSYVRTMTDVMARKGIRRGLIFCSPGLSGNGAVFAQQHGVNWYTLNAMNQWIEEVLVSEYAGPTGDILENLVQLEKFLRSLNPNAGTRRNR